MELKPIVTVGKAGSDERIVKALDEALDAHELVKVKFSDFKDAKRAIAEDLAASTSSEIVMIIGNIAILYREQEDLTLRRFHLPKR